MENKDTKDQLMQIERSSYALQVLSRYSQVGKLNKWVCIM